MPGDGAPSWKEEGRQEGRLESEVVVVFRQLRRRCGVPTLTEEIVRGLSSLDLEDLADALLDFSSLANLEHWLDARAGK